MSISQGNGPLTAGMADGLGATLGQSDSEKLDALYRRHADPGDVADADETAEQDDVEDPDDMFNNDALRD